MKIPKQSGRRLAVSIIATAGSIGFSQNASATQWNSGFYPLHCCKDRCTFTRGPVPTTYTNQDCLSTYGPECPCGSGNVSCVKAGSTDCTCTCYTTAGALSMCHFSMASGDASCPSLALNCTSSYVSCNSGGGSCTTPSGWTNVTSGSIVMYMCSGGAYRYSCNAGHYGAPSGSTTSVSVSVNNCSGCPAPVGMTVSPGPTSNIGSNTTLNTCYLSNGTTFSHTGVGSGVISGSCSASGSG